MSTILKLNKHDNQGFIEESLIDTSKVQININRFYPIG